MQDSKVYYDIDGVLVDCFLAGYVAYAMAYQAGDFAFPFPYTLSQWEEDNASDFAHPTAVKAIKDALFPGCLKAWARPMLTSFELKGTRLNTRFVVTSGSANAALMKLEACAPHLAHRLIATPKSELKEGLLVDDNPRHRAIAAANGMHAELPAREKMLVWPHLSYQGDVHKNHFLEDGQWWRWNV